MTHQEQIAAIRNSVGMSRLDHVRYVRIAGADAAQTLDRVICGALRVRDGQIRHTLLLTEEAFPLADVYVGRDDEDFFLLAEGIEAEDLVAHLRTHAPTGADVRIEDLSETHAILGLDGPYAWELLGAAVDPEVIGLPYLTFYHHRGLVCYRAGKTGEFGYGVILERDRALDLQERLRRLGTAFDAVDVHLDALDHCALENWFFNIRREGRERVTPIELQLQWRVSYHKDFVGSTALRQRRADGAKARLTGMLADRPVSPDNLVTVDDQVVGRIVNAGYSDAREAWVALALLDLQWAYPGINEFTVNASGGGKASGRSVSPPVLMNRSLSVSPQLHSYATRHEFKAPPPASH